MNPICLTEHQKNQYFKVFDRQRWQFLNAYTDRFKDALTKQIEPVLSELDKGISEAMSQVDIIQAEPVRRAYSQLYTQIGTYYASNVFNGLKSHFGYQTKNQDDLFIRFMQSWVELEGAKLVQQVSDNTKQYLREILQRGIEANLTTEEIARQMRDSNRIAGITRGRVIARTEIIRASNVGSLQGAKNSNLNLLKEWLPTLDGRQRDEHGAMANADPIPMDAEFSLGGYPCRYPGDISLPASESIQCRCSLGYIPA